MLRDADAMRITHHRLITRGSGHANGWMWTAMMLLVVTSTLAAVVSAAATVLMAILPLDEYIRSRRSRRGRHRGG